LKRLPDGSYEPTAAGGVFWLVVGIAAVTFFVLRECGVI